MKHFFHDLKWIGAALLLGTLTFVGILWWGTSHASGNLATVTVPIPTQYTDDSTLPLTDLASVTISWNGTVSGSQTVTTFSGANVVLQVPLACGDTAFTAVWTTTAKAKWPNASSLPGGPVPYSTGIKCAPKSVAVTVS